LDALEMASGDPTRREAAWWEYGTREQAGQDVTGVVHHSDAGSQLRFKGSWQHLEPGGVVDHEESVCVESGEAGADGVSGASPGERPGCSTPVLDRDREGSVDRGRGGDVRRVGPGGIAGVP